MSEKFREISYALIVLLVDISIIYKNGRIQIRMIKMKKMLMIILFNFFIVFTSYISEASRLRKRCWNNMTTKRISINTLDTAIAYPLFPLLNVS